VSGRGGAPVPRAASPGDLAPASRPLRLFVALDLPDAIRDHLARVSAAVDPEVWRPVAPAALHVTLAFLGPRPPGDVDRIAPILAAEDGGPAPTLTLAGPLLLPPRRARVLAAALGDSTGALAALQARLTAALTAAGVHIPERRAFRPHVTLARLRPRATAPRTVPLALEALQSSAPSVTLYESRLHPTGARYVALARATLG
jgi:RNA 2',3'-cyclic 3'-phosphodiesterase